MQPVQLSLLPEKHPALPAMVFAQLPGRQVTAAVTLLAGLIARAAALPAAATAALAEVSGDE
ncbi:MAG: hypothetical protein DLM64_10645 [Solirubrobacterales bacterium]|nr:MAG: hypothetical protein DLM64_10645 [Solirubrobacterales bacterium]